MSDVDERFAQVRAEHSGKGRKVSTIPVSERAGLDIEDAAAYLGVGRCTIYALLNDGDIEGFKVGHKRLIKRQSLDDFIERARAAG